MPSLSAVLRAVLIVPLMSLYLVIGDALLWLDETIGHPEPTP